MSILRHPTGEWSIKPVKGPVTFMRSKHIIFLTIGLLFSCQSRDRTPAGILSQGEMVQVLADIYVSEEKVSSLNLAHDSAQAVSDVFRAKVLENVSMTDSVFKKSFDYYMDRPAEMEVIYTILVDTLQLREQRTSQRPERNRQ